MATISRGNVKMTLQSVRSTKWRSLLTMLGVIIGIVSVVMTVGIGEGVKQEVAKQVNQFGDDLITVRPGNVEQRNGKIVTNTDLLFGLNSISGLTEKDLQTVQKSDNVRLAAPLSVISGAVQADDRKLDNSLVLATNNDLPGALNRSIRYGDFFDTNDTQGNFAVIGRHVADTLFDEQIPLGRSFTFRGQTFVVRGMFDEFKSTPLSPVSNFNDAIFIPYKTAERLTGNSAQMYSILAKPDKPADTSKAIASVQGNMLSSHGGQKDFSVLDQKQNLAASSDVLSLITAMIAAIAGISLLVGGVGIMNIMLATVTERMHEIGIRKAIGATNRQILNQFVLEAAILSLFGGVVGIIVSVAGVYALRLYTDLQPVLSWQAIVIATLTSLAIGIIFGALPAVKAARKDPIEALRHE
jgi:putative ABC transport system permease protein